MIVVVDTYCANISSVVFAIERLGFSAQLSSAAKDIRQASKVILPGVANAKHAMENLRELQLVDTLRSLTQPMLGICIGMHLLYDASVEGNTDCLAIIPGTVSSLPTTVTIPHMGWNQLNITQSSPLLVDVPTGSYVYFVHSYAAPQTANSCAVVNYPDPITAVVQKDNFFGTQFHPERSSHVGHLILKNFLEMS